MAPNTDAYSRTNRIMKKSICVADSDPQEPIQCCGSEIIFFPMYRSLFGQGKRKGKGQMGNGKRKGNGAGKGEREEEAEWKWEETGKRRGKDDITCTVLVCSLSKKQN